MLAFVSGSIFTERFDMRDVKAMTLHLYKQGPTRNKYILQSGVETKWRRRRQERFMAKYGELLEKILKGRADANIAFEDIRLLLLHLGFDERIRGSHHIFRRSDVEDRVNLQRDGKQAKPYQVRQVRAVILRYSLGSEL